jgi:serine/threonine protein phosphatase PrpC
MSARSSKDKASTSPKGNENKLSLSFGGYSCAGKKAQNQDVFAALIPQENDIVSKGIVATIADGVSSASKAAEAAQLSVTQFINDYYATPETWSTQKSAAKVLTSLNQWLYSQSDGINKQSTEWLTTFSALIVKSSTGYIFHVGDTRISLFRENKISAITHDHNRKQSHGHTVLTRALGADSRLKVDAHQVDIQAGDIYLLTCDGVHEYLTDKQISAELLKLNKQNDSPPTNQALEQGSRQLTQLAIEHGSDDNVSCLLVYINSTPNRELIEIERDLLNKTIPPALSIGMKLDGYKVCKIIHASTRSHIYLVESLIENSVENFDGNLTDNATENKTDKTLSVLKVPSENFSDDPFYLQGFMREAWLGERINHQHVMKIKTANINSPFLYHICEYINGQTLTQWMFDNPLPNIAQVRDIIQQITHALRTFQRLELVHRDLKPDNIMIGSNGQIKLIDYGTVLIASLAENSDTLTETQPQGTLNYIAPETLLTLKADHQSDLFSLGVIAYEMLCGELPYKPMRRAEVCFSDYSQWQYRSIKQFRGDFPIWLDLALEKSTKANPNFRYHAFSEFNADLNKPNLSAIEDYKNQPIMQRNPVQFWQGISALLFMVLTIVLIN